ncbi:MAG: DnaJ domain-containing protein [Pseudomonadota bacterium]
MNALLPWAGGAVLLAALAILLLRLPKPKAIAALLFAAAAGLAVARQFALAVPLAWAALALWRTGGGFGGLAGGLGRGPGGGSPRQGQVSEVNTDWFEMTLDHDSGEIDGTIRQGTFEGMTLSSCSLEELKALWSEIKSVEDSESLSLLEAYVARHRPDAAGAEHGSASGRSSHAGVSGEEMSTEDAFKILGVEPGASLDEIRAAHRRLIRKLHPDSGGSSTLAALINAARRKLDPG